MASQQRIEDLTAYCKGWAESSAHAAAHRDWLLELQAKGVTIADATSANLIPELIAEADFHARRNHRIRTYMESLRDRAINGEDV